MQDDFFVTAVHIIPAYIVIGMAMSNNITMHNGCWFPCANILLKNHLRLW